MSKIDARKVVFSTNKRQRQTEMRKNKCDEVNKIVSEKESGMIPYKTNIL